jgi:hypothetical protein
MKTLVTLLKVLTVFAAPVVSIVAISFISDLVWTLAQALGAGNALVGFVINLATMAAVTATLVGWAFSLPVDIAEILELEEDLK